MSLFFPMRNQEWPRWYRALTISGKPAGLGFCCPKCHLRVSYGAEAGVQHCGSLEKPPMITALLPVRGLGPRQELLPANILPIGFDDDKEKEDGKHSIFWT